MANFNPTDPHANQPILQAGPPPEQAKATLILVHGRGATAQGMMPLADELQLENLAVLAPQATGASWYPLSFLSPMQMNEPFLSSALMKLNSIVEDLIARGVASRRIALLGFSQGACLTLETVARHPRRFGAVMALSGGLIGPPGTGRNYAGRLDGTPIFIGAADPDPHIPIERAQESEQVLQRMGATVQLRRYPNMPHTINPDELGVCRTLMQSVGA